jgi:cytosine/adenosine deaminase-related metal-dependent hydrolase
VQAWICRSPSALWLQSSIGVAWAFPIASRRLQPNSNLLVSFTDDPFLADPPRAFVHEPDGLVICRNGLIEAVGSYNTLRSKLSADIPITDYSGCIISPGFIDTHVHYVQTGIIAAPGKQLVQ